MAGFRGGCARAVAGSGAALLLGHWGGGCVLAGHGGGGDVLRGERISESTSIQISSCASLYSEMKQPLRAVDHECVSKVLAKRGDKPPAKAISASDKTPPSVIPSQRLASFDGYRKTCGG